MSVSDIADEFLRLKTMDIEDELGPARFKILLYFLEREIPIPKIAKALGLRPFDVVLISRIITHNGLVIQRELRDMIPRSPVHLVYSRSDMERETAA